MAEFVAELRQLSEFCEFGATLEDMLRDRLVCGISSSSIQRRLLAEPELTLQKAQDLAQAIESADKNVRDLQGQRQPPATSTLHAVTRRQAPRWTRARTDSGKTVEIPCCRCGGKDLPRDCRFKTAVCHSCKKRGHLSRMCRAKGTQTAIAGRHSGEVKQQTHSLESEVTQPRNPGSDPEAFTLFPINSQRVTRLRLR